MIQLTRTKKEREIQGLLAHHIRHEKIFIIWQNDAIEGRKMAKVTGCPDALYKQTYSFKPQHKKKKFPNFNVNEEIYLCSVGEDFIAKTKVVQLEAASIVLACPMVAQFQEKRVNPRKVVNIFGKNIRFNFANRSFDCPLYDFSMGGVTFLIHSRELSKFTKGDTIRIASLLDRVIPGCIRAKIVQLTPYDFENYRVGIQYERLFSTNPSRREVEEMGIKAIESILNSY